MQRGLACRTEAGHADLGLPGDDSRPVAAQRAGVATWGEVELRLRSTAGLLQLSGGG